MRLEFGHAYTAPQSIVWQYLQNPRVLERALPGCISLRDAGEGHYLVEMGLDIGPVKGLFTGSVDLLELEEPNQYRLVLNGVGKPGELQADAWIRLKKADTGTEVVCDAEVHVTGIMASVGQRIMGGVARLLLGRFFKNVESEIKKATIPS